MKYSLEQRLPEVHEYLDLRRSVGWPLFDEEVVRVALQRTLFGVCVTSDDITIGMGRIVGDGAVYFHIQDVIVATSHQRSGVGKLIMDSLLKYIDDHAVPNANIGLMCSKGREEFYEGFGFVIRPSEIYGAGMILIK